MTDVAEPLAKAVRVLAGWLRDAPSIVVLTGAGVSAASGVPTFRGQGGLWRQFRAEQLATPDAFARDPALVWEWYAWRRQRIAACAPNAAHEVLARWCARWPHLTLITQNVDGLHERAGAGEVLRLHGSIWDVRCASGCAAGQTPRRLEQVPLAPLPPRCPYCGGLDRPDVVWFGEPLDPAVLARASDAARTCHVFLAVGTSAMVYPAAGLIPAHEGATSLVAEINPDDTPMSRAVLLKVSLPAEIVLPAIDAALGQVTSASGP